MVITTYANEEKKDKLSNDIFVLKRNVGDFKAGLIIRHRQICPYLAKLTDELVNSGKGKGSRSLYLFEYYEDGEDYAQHVHLKPTDVRFATDEEKGRFYQSEQLYNARKEALKSEEARKAKERLDALAEEERKRKEFAETYKNTLAYKIRFGLFYRPIGVVIFCFCSFLRTFEGCLSNLQFYWMNKMYKNLYLSKVETWNMQYAFGDIAAEHSHKWFRILTKISALKTRCSYEYDYCK